MASLEQCEQAFGALAQRLAGADPEARRRSTLDRSLSCTITDLDVIFGAQLREGLLQDIRRVDEADGQIKLRMSGDDLLKLVDGDLHFASAWASGRVKIDARMSDLLKLRSVF